MVKCINVCSTVWIQSIIFRKSFLGTDPQITKYRYDSLQCEVIRSEQFENWHFSWAYNLWITRFEEKIPFARHDYGRVGVFNIRIRSLVKKLQPLGKCQFSNCSHQIASHCTCGCCRGGTWRGRPSWGWPWRSGWPPGGTLCFLDTGSPVKHGRLFLLPWKKWLVYSSVYWTNHF